MCCYRAGVVKQQSQTTSLLTQLAGHAQTHPSQHWYLGRCTPHGPTLTVCRGVQGQAGGLAGSQPLLLRAGCHTQVVSLAMPRLCAE